MSDSEDIWISEAEFRKRYEFGPGDLLGEGGFAQVFKAFDKQLGIYVALKLFNKGEKGKYDVLNEIKNSISLSHKNIIRVYNALVVNFEYAVANPLVQVGVLEYANGGNLRDFIASKPSENAFIDVLTGIIEALMYLHSEKCIIHRDLSPENILMCIENDKWIPKLADFGISKRIIYGAMTGDQKKSSQLLGKLDYMAPEQFDPVKFGTNGKINTNVDLWAFGIILYELFRHTTPFGTYTESDNVYAVQSSIMNDPPPDISDIPEPYRKIIERCLEKKASGRVQSAGELIPVLKEKARGSHTKEVTSIPFIRDFRKPAGKILRMLLYLVLLAVPVGAYFSISTLINNRNVKRIADINELMVAKRFSEARYLFDQLPERIINNSELSKLYEECKINKYSLDLSDFIKNRQFKKALEYFENLPDNIRSDSSLNALYRQAELYRATDSLKILIEAKNISDAIKLYDQLKDDYKKNPEIIALNKELSKASEVESLINRGEDLFSKKDYQQARILFDKALKYDPKNKEALLMVGRIDKMKIPSPEKNQSVPISNPCLERYSGYKLRMGQSPDTNIVRLSGICITESSMRITLRIKASETRFRILSPREPNAFNLSFNGMSLKLRDIKGEIIVNSSITITKPTDIDLIFDKLPQDIKIFSLEQKDTKGSYWIFKNIRLEK